MQVLYDLRHAVRLLQRQPLFTAAATLTLALGVGANVAVFAVVEAVLLRPLPYPDAERLLILHHRDDRTRIEELLGTTEGVGELTALIERTGALAAVEADIARLEGEALAALDRFPHDARAAVESLVRSATRRER